MKQFHAYKKLFNLILSLQIVLLLFLIISPVSYSYASTVSDLKNKISQKDADIAKLEEEINLFQNQLDVIGNEKSSLSNSIKELDLTRKKLMADISVTQNKIDKTSLKIESLSSDIGDKESIIANDLNSIELGIQTINENEGSSILESLLSDRSFADVWRDTDNIVTIHEQVRLDILHLKQIKGDLEDTRTETMSAKKDLLTLKSKLDDQKKIIIQNTNEKNALLKQTQNNEANYRKLLKDRMAQRDAFEKEIQDYEMQLQYILDPSTLPKGRILSWPLEKIYVTQPFGATTLALYAAGKHSGVDFRASVGTPVMSMSDGTVMGTGDTDLTCPEASFGKFVFIVYDNGLSSTYGHLSLIKVSNGQKVKRGEVVAYSGNTGHSTGPHLHVALYAPKSAKMTAMPSVACKGKTYNMPVAPAGAYLNALDYLPPYKLNTTISAKAGE